MIAERTARALPIIQERSNFTRPQAVKIPGSNPALTDALPLPPEMLSLSVPQVVAQQLVTLSGSALRILHVSDTHHSQAECLNIPARYSSACSASNTTAFLRPTLPYPASGCVETTGCVDLRRSLIRMERPDLALYVGDLIDGRAQAKGSAAGDLHNVLRPAIDATLPWSASLGNHDGPDHNLNLVLSFSPSRPSAIAMC